MYKLRCNAIINVPKTKIAINLSFVLTKCIGRHKTSKENFLKRVICCFVFKENFLIFYLSLSLNQMP